MNIGLLLYWQTGGDSSGFVCCGGIIVFIVIIVVLALQAGNEQTKRMNAERARMAKQLKEAKDDYFDSLRRLKSNPTNADVRERTLHLGRTYSNLTRNQSGVTVFDEVALSNDINAACAGAATLVANTNTQSQTIESRLQQLAELKSKGLLDQEEYVTRRQQIIDEV